MKMPKFEHILAENKSIDVKSFMGYFYLWKYVSTKLPLPIPHLERIIPYVVSRWNSIKGGSNAITALICMYHLAVHLKAMPFHECFCWGLL
jgi:hypothetical protein